MNYQMDGLFCKIVHQEQKHVLIYSTEILTDMSSLVKYLIYFSILKVDVSKGTLWTIDE